MNKQEFSGRLTAEPVLKNVGDKQVCTFRLAINGRKNDPAVFINCEAWGALAEAIANYTHKGHRLGVVTHMKQHSYEKNGVKITADDFVVEDIDFIEKKEEV